MNSTGISILTQLLPAIPLLLVYAVGMILALVNWHRFPTPCLLVMVGSGVLLVLTVVQPALTTYLVQSRSESGRSSVELTQLFAVVGLVSGALRAAAFGAIVAAVFVQRKSATAS